MKEDDPRQPQEIPINGILDLHGFQPSEVKELLDEYLKACLEKGIKQGRIIHGKGIGTLRETVHAKLRNDPRVLSFALGDMASGSWGATNFTLA